ncbi:MAG TPA: hypothetical protein ENK44_09270 [Caldithrix abyssi]|uniref:Nudix hydrolase domain-containing protein n=1 Tax=Caldithrix abyssi TaxID=187145 RepID=A0A7V4WV59_CALAY|nr:hypothetical protein [Caldithrix abyssi]
MENLQNSLLANPLGINLLLFTTDGRMVISSRSSRVLVRPNELGPSSFGDLIYMDLPTTSQLKLNHFPHLRETFEELGLHPEDIDSTEITF